MNKKGIAALSLAGVLQSNHQHLKRPTFKPVSFEKVEVIEGRDVKETSTYQ